MVLYFSFLYYTDSNFGLNDGTITNITVSGGTGTVLVTITNSSNVVVYTGVPGLADQTNLPPDIYTLSAVDQAGEVSDDLEITIAEKPETVLTANITDACNCGACDCVVTISDYVHNSDCFIYELYDGANLVATHQACAGDEYYQFTGLCTGDYLVRAIELDSIRYTYNNPDNCDEEDVVITTALDVNDIVGNWRRFAINNTFFQFNLFKAAPTGPFKNGTTNVLDNGNGGGWSGLKQNGTIDYTNPEAFFFTGGNPASYTDPASSTYCPTCTGSTPLDADATRFLGAFNGGQDGLKPPIFPAGWPDPESDTLKYGLYYYNLDTGLFVHTADINGSVGGFNYQWVTFNPKDQITNIDGVAWPNATDFYTTNAQWTVNPVNPATDYTVDPNTDKVVDAQSIGVTEKISCEENSTFKNGFISECRYLNYEHTITIGSTANDDDDISIILARYVNEEGYTQTLSVTFRIRSGPGEPNGGAVAIEHNSEGAAQRDISRFHFNNQLEPDDPNFESSPTIILNNTTGVNNPLPAANFPTVSWQNQGKIRVKIKRTGAQGEFFKIQMTDRIGPDGVIPVNAVADYVAAYEINFSILDMNTWTDAPVFTNGTPLTGNELAGYVGPTNYGYATYSQPKTDFYHILFQGEQTNTTNDVIDLPGAIDELEFTEPCELCYRATNCEEPAEQILVLLPADLPPLDTSVTYVFNEFPDKCWTVEASEDCYGTPVDPILLNTGFIDASNTLGEEDDQDFNWELIVESDNVPITPRPAIVSDQNWFTGYGSIFNALWLTQTVSPHPSLGGFSEYRLQFNLPASFVPSLTLDMLTDNTAVITLNGFVIGDTSNPAIYPSPWVTPSTFTTNNPTHFNPGASNELIVRVKDSFTENQSNGFVLAGQIISEEEPQPSTPVTIAEIFECCEECTQVCYELTDCEGEKDPIQTNSDLSQYVGQVVNILTCPETCWTVTEIECPTSTQATYLETVYVKDNFVDCVSCLPSPEPVTPFEIKSRTVKPGYNTIGCSPEYVQKISCDYSEALYQEAITRRYGIEFCCSLDFDSLDIKKQLMDFKMITDPEACSRIECCPPCNVEAEILAFNPILCLAPTDVQSFFFVPPRTVSPDCRTVRMSLSKDCFEDNVTFTGFNCAGEPITVILNAGNTNQNVCVDVALPWSVSPGGCIEATAITDACI
jgi:hypothetical protein